MSAAGRDTSQMYMSKSSTLPGWREPSYPINVVGVVAQYSSAATVYNNGYEIEPRDTTDILHTHLAPIVSIAEARKDVNGDFIPDHSVTGDTLAVHGVVTSPNLAALAGGTLYFIQDTSGGIAVAVASLTSTTFARGDSVVIVGTITQANGLTEIVPTSLDAAHFGILKHNTPAPVVKHVTLTQFFKNGEPYEGLLVEIDSLAKAPESAVWGSDHYIYLANYFVNGAADTAQPYVTLYLNPNTNVGSSHEPAYPVNVTGIVSQYGSLPRQYELIPRDTSDIVHFTITGVNGLPTGVPATYSLSQNYPNPFNPSTTIQYALPKQSRVAIKVYSLLGQVVATLVDNIQEAGYHNVVWNGRTSSGVQTATGLYFLRIVAEPANGSGSAFVQVRKMMMLK
jgi:hypothetical protein